MTNTQETADPFSRVPVPSLFDWAGGMPTLEKLTARFYDKVREDELLAPVFAKTILHAGPVGLNLNLCEIGTGSQSLGIDADGFAEKVISGGDWITDTAVLVESTQLAISATPEGWANGFMLEYCGSIAAFFINSVQMGAAVCAPLSRKSL